MTQASHQLDLMQWICGMPVSVLARCSTIGRPIQVENEAELFLTYLNGAHGHFIASAHECPGTNLLEICGTRGRISVRDDSEVEIIRLEEDERTFARSCPSPFEQVSGTVERLTFDDRNNKAQQAATICKICLPLLRGPGQSNAAWRKVCDPSRSSTARISLTGWAARSHCRGMNGCFAVSLIVQEHQWP